jgi:hypothetical protein
MKILAILVKYFPPFRMALLLTKSVSSDFVIVLWMCVLALTLGTWFFRMFWRVIVRTPRPIFYPPEDDERLKQDYVSGKLQTLLANDWLLSLCGIFCAYLFDTYQPPSIRPWVLVIVWLLSFIPLILCAEKTMQFASCTKALRAQGLVPQLQPVFPPTTEKKE